MPWLARDGGLELLNPTNTSESPDGAQITFIP